MSRPSPNHVTLQLPNNITDLLKETDCLFGPPPLVRIAYPVAVDYYNLLIA